MQLVSDSIVRLSRVISETDCQAMSVLAGWHRHCTVCAFISPLILFKISDLFLLSFRQAEAWVGNSIWTSLIVKHMVSGGPT